MCLNSFRSRTSPIYRVFVYLSLFFTLYVLLLSGSSILERFRIRSIFPKLRLTTTTNAGQNHHQLGQIITSNGSFMYFHLPSLNDYNIENDYFSFNDGAKYCLKSGTLAADVDAVNPFFCACKSNYSGDDCAIPRLVRIATERYSDLVITKLAKPRRLVLSLIWFPGHRSNESSWTGLDQLKQTLDALAPYTDLFIIHDVQLGEQEDPVDDDLPHPSIQYQLEKGSLRRFQSITIPLTHTITPDSPKFNLDRFEYELMKKSWMILTKQVTEYRPSDLLFLMSVNNFPKAELLTYFKHHAGIDDIVHLMPIHSWLVEGNGTLLASTNNYLVNIRVDSIVDKPIPELLVYHLKNVLVTFQFVSFLCRYDFDHFSHNYCLSDQELVKQFVRNFWNIHKTQLGSDNDLRINSTTTIFV